jgi:hypothetical protein
LTFNTPEAEFKKVRIYDMEIICEPLQLALDYVDIDLFYYFSLRYADTIAPAWANYMAPYDYIQEEVISDVGSVDSDKDKNEDCFHKDI